MSRRGGLRVASEAAESIATDAPIFSRATAFKAQARQEIRKARTERAVDACSLCGETDHRIDHRDVCTRCAAMVDAGTVVQLRRRRAASDRLVPLSDGRRDPWGPTSDGAA